MRDKLLIYAVAGIIIFFLGFIAHLQYFQTKDNLISLYSQKQGVVANQAAYSIQKTIRQRVRSVEGLKEISQRGNWDYSQLTSEFALAHNLVDGFKYLLVIDSLGNSITGYPEGFPCPSRQPKHIRSCFKEILRESLAKQKTMIFERNEAFDKNMYICIICPIEIKDKPEIKAIIGVLDVKATIVAAVEPIVIDSRDLTWVINAKGYLVYHRYHEELLAKNLFDAPKLCYQCHNDFKAEKLMITGGQGVITKESILGKRYLVGYSMVSILNIKWLVGISTPFETITSALRSEFKNFLFLIIFIIITIVTGAVIFNRINSKSLLARSELENLRVQHQLIKEKTAAESRYRMLVEQSPDPIFLCTRRRILMVNPAFEKIFGIKTSEIASQSFNIEQLIDEKSREFFKREIVNFISKRKTRTFISVDMRSMKGKKIEAEISLSRFRLNNAIVYQGIIHDVTRTRQLERQQERRKNLALIGEMAARIAHEIKNPLASIQTGIQLLETQVSKDSKEKSYYDRLLKEIQRVDIILKGLLSYAKQDIVVKKRTDLKSLIERFGQVIQPTMERNKIDFIIETDKELPDMWLDEHRFEQVLWNITLNAVQASKENSQIICKVSLNGKNVQLQICDKGNGIPKEMLNKIFDPFFSTRTHGSGLGLAISKKIIEQHGGKLFISSKVNEGTIVTILLPVDVKGEV